MKIKRYLFSLVFLLFSFTALADPPVVMLKGISAKIIDQLEQHKGGINKQVINHIVHQLLLPHVDLEIMSRSVVGNQYWSKATPEQKAQFKRAFMRLVINVYSTPISSYNGETIEFKPLRDQSTARPQVESVIIRKNGQRIPVSYRLIQSGGSWKIYDFSVEGISMISSYRSQFDSILQQKGMTGLLTRLSAQ
jgi:phospholipid transport system substrate-binding protein